MSQSNQLLAIIEHGGYPDFFPLYAELGLNAQRTPTMRKALTICKKQKPEIIVAEFIYAPTYGSYICNLESLFAALQSHSPNSQLIVLIDKENLHHLEKVKDRFPIAAVLNYPIQKTTLKAALEQILTTSAT